MFLLGIINSKLSLQSASLLETYCANACSDEALEKLYADYEQVLLKKRMPQRFGIVMKVHGFPLSPKVR